jgi:hypothetical protein
MERVHLEVQNQSFFKSALDGRSTKLSTVTGKCSWLWVKPGPSTAVQTLWSIATLHFHLLCVLWIVSFPQVSPPNPVWTFLLHHKRGLTFPPYSSPFRITKYYLVSMTNCEVRNLFFLIVMSCLCRNENISVCINFEKNRVASYLVRYDSHWFMCVSVWVFMTEHYKTVSVICNLR